MTPRNCFHRILPPTAQSRSGGWLTFLTFACLGIIGSISGLHADDAPQPPRRIFVPTENLDALLSRDRGGVVLTQDEFTQLLQDAGIAAELSSPDTAVLTAANYTARIDGEQLVV
ncbi:MAG: hypothetical protein KDA75_21480, partial [Planctomycetaceae bacterium]|nr:hypothetical protein [Planctomycetaceae bacterium]